MLAESTPSTRRKDSDTNTADETPLALGLSKAFDSLDATMRLAIQTGMTTDAKSLAPTTGGTSGAVSGTAFPVRVPSGWSNLDKLVFAAGVAGAIIIGVVIIFV